MSLKWIALVCLDGIFVYPKLSGCKNRIHGGSYRMDNTDDRMRERMDNQDESIISSQVACKKCVERDQK